jgi:hypothetical protein
MKASLIGGGSDNKLGIDKVKLHVLQNQVKNTLTGHYGKGTLTFPVVGGLPAVDANAKGVDTPFMDFPGKVLPDNTSADREISTADDPDIYVPNDHQDTKALVKSVSGGFEFKTALASVSDDAKNAIMVHAYTTWSTDFSGVITLDPDVPLKLPGEWEAKGARTGGLNSFVLISEKTGGQDAGVAGIETFPPIGRDTLMEYHKEPYGTGWKSRPHLPPR